MTQELGILALIKRGMSVVTTSGDVLMDSSDPSRTMMRQIASSFAQYEKARLVAKLKAARDRVRTEKGKCGGRKSYAESKPETVALAKQLRARGMTFRKIPDSRTGEGRERIPSALRESTRRRRLHVPLAVVA
jgi:DNA invertase Pin-like site-specific DNA recombinase